LIDTNGRENRDAAVDTLWRVVTDAENLDDICRGFVFSEWANAECWGAYIYSLGQNLDLAFEAGFGRKRDEVQRFLDETEYSELDRILREKEACMRPLGQTSLVFVPLIRLDIPIGLIVFVSRLSNGLAGGDDTFKQISRALGFSLAVFRLQTQRTSGPANRTEGTDVLSARQLNILRGISQGMTNRQISSELMVSESTVRHETMRIYNFFNVGGRHEAITVARGAGYLV
jgi:DNA-binding CsgD family transcriptional regulator